MCFAASVFLSELSRYSAPRIRLSICVGQSGCKSLYSRWRVPHRNEGACLHPFVGSMAALHTTDGSLGTWDSSTVLRSPGFLKRSSSDLCLPLGSMAVLRACECFRVQADQYLILSHCHVESRMLTSRDSGSEASSTPSSSIRIFSELSTSPWLCVSGDIRSPYRKRATAAKHHPGGHR